MKSIYLSEEHEQFRASVRQFFEKEVEHDRWEQERRIPDEIWRKMGELGFLGINYPEEYGGAQADFFYSAVFLEELGRVGLGGFGAAVGVQQYMATAHIYKFGSELLKQKYLVPSISGKAVGALAISEPGAGSDVAAIRTTARREGDVFVVNGSKTFITNGVYGDFATVAVKTGDATSSAVSLLVIESNSPGYSATKLNKMGWHSSDTAELTFEDVRVPVENLVGEEGKGFYYIMECFQLERLVAALSANGGSEKALEVTLDYIKQREVFGRSVSRYQTIRHRFVEMCTELEACRQLTYHTCWLYENGHHAVKECSMVKMMGTELGKRIADECLQFYGGYGFMEEYPMARFYRDARVGTIVGGTTEIMKEILAKIIVDEKSYQAPSQNSSSSTSQTTEELSIAALFEALPSRYRGAAEQTSRVQFDFQEDGNGTYTVNLDGGTCTVKDGMLGEPTCVVTTPGQVYLDIESGKQSPEMAFMSGQIHVTDIPEMMTFIKSFKKRAPT